MCVLFKFNLAFTLSTLAALAIWLLSAMLTLATGQQSEKTSFTLGGFFIKPRPWSLILRRKVSGLVFLMVDHRNSTQLAVVNCEHLRDAQLRIPANLSGRVLSANASSPNRLLLCNQAHIKIRLRWRSHTPGEFLANFATDLSRHGRNLLRSRVRSVLPSVEAHLGNLK